MRAGKGSRASLSMVSAGGSGVYLNGAGQGQYSFVAIRVQDPEGKEIMEIDMTMDQLATLLTSNMDTPVTLSRYMGSDGNIHKEVVDPPASIQDKTSSMMKDIQGALDSRLNDLIEDLRGIVDGTKSSGKKAIGELLKSAEVIRSHYVANQEFVLSEAQKSVNEMKEDSFRQLVHEFASATRNEDAVKKICSAFEGDEIKMIADAPVIDDYEEKEKKDVPIEEMNARQVAKGLNTVIRNYSRDSANDLFQPSCFEQNGRIKIVYISYHGGSNLSIERARGYLKFLSGGVFTRHFEWERKEGLS